MKTKQIISGLALIAITTIASAQSNKVPPCQKNSTGTGVAYIDANNNGICDNFENSPKTVAQRKRGGNGGNCQAGARGRGTGQGQGKGRNFVDADKNGICDHSVLNSKK